MKNDREGQAAILTNADYSKIRSKIISRKYKLLFDLAWYTGERWGAIVKLRVADVYTQDGTPREYINFRARTRKAKPKTPDKAKSTQKPKAKRSNRQVPVHPVLAELLSSYKPDPGVEWLFPCRTGDKPITLRWADDILRSAVDKAGLSGKGVSTHSTRRTFITNLAKNGINLAMIKKITGHADLKVLSAYIEVSEDDMKNAIATL
ncbi:integrase [Nostoc linckia z18]|uniref:Integrase n=2 Tax=Nostoc linckia TaxID=92942 RepID=A0A9Q5Z954_NOSLI|nr:site-specific integrase [Nostoc linckia]PHK38802.1 integrase [Nostoc linckia z15]PHK44320.1 integrase [Nostoc linckia z16]PHJ62800.1 integrase [Nostoc linckia z1]PHJ66629.1 integrase [Nostoc linckia z3]PHJ72750.1 integrase [Nostoc linckia z2]